MTELEAFEKLWSIRGHAQAIVEGIKIDGIKDERLLVLKDTITRMSILLNECLLYRNIKP